MPGQIVMAQKPAESSGLAAQSGEVAEIRLNGGPREIPAGSTVGGLLELLGLKDVPVLVEHNGVALFPRDFPAAALKAGDQVEIIRIVAGG